VSNRTLLRVEMLDGMTKWRPLVDLEHSTLCRQFGLDPCTYYFDLPASARGVGSASSGSRGARTIDGYVMHGPTQKPAGKITFAREGERFRDDDPTDPDATLRLG
jgi:hypothetical protein